MARGDEGLGRPNTAILYKAMRIRSLDKAGGQEHGKVSLVARMQYAIWNTCLCPMVGKFDTVAGSCRCATRVCKAAGDRLLTWYADTAVLGARGSFFRFLCPDPSRLPLPLLPSGPPTPASAADSAAASAPGSATPAGPTGGFTLPIPMMLLVRGALAEEGAGLGAAAPFWAAPKGDAPAAALWPGVPCFGTASTSSSPAPPPPVPSQCTVPMANVPLGTPSASDSSGGSGTPLRDAGAGLLTAAAAVGAAAVGAVAAADAA